MNMARCGACGAHSLWVEGVLRWPLDLVGDPPHPDMPAEVGALHREAEKIGRLVEQGIAKETQQAMDVVRVVGNNGAHPGEINLDEDGALIPSLFKLMNMIINDLVARPRLIEEFYMSLPPGALDAVERRDAARTSDEPRVGRTSADSRERDAIGRERGCRAVGPSGDGPPQSVHRHDVDPVIEGVGAGPGGERDAGDEPIPEGPSKGAQSFDVAAGDSLVGLDLDG